MSTDFALPEVKQSRGKLVISKPLTILKITEPRNILANTDRPTIHPTIRPTGLQKLRRSLKVSGSVALTILIMGLLSLESCALFLMVPC